MRDPKDYTMRIFLFTHFLLPSSSSPSHSIYFLRVMPEDLGRAIIVLKDQLEYEVAAREQAEKYLPIHTRLMCLIFFNLLLILERKGFWKIGWKGWRRT
jgi:hypothetical protein